MLLFCIFVVLFSGGGFHRRSVCGLYLAWAGPTVHACVRIWLGFNYLASTVCISKRSGCARLQWVCVWRCLFLCLACSQNETMTMFGADVVQCSCLSSVQVRVSLGVSVCVCCVIGWSMQFICSHTQPCDRGDKMVITCCQTMERRGRERTGRAEGRDAEREIVYERARERNWVSESV